MLKKKIVHERRKIIIIMVWLMKKEFCWVSVRKGGKISILTFICFKSLSFSEWEINENCVWKRKDGKFAWENNWLHVFVCYEKWNEELTF